MYIIVTCHVSRVTWISPDECDLRVWAWAGVPHHALDVEAGGGPGHGDVQPLHVSRVTSSWHAAGHVSPGSTSRPCRTDSGCRWGWWPAAAPPAWARVTCHVTCYVSRVTRYLVRRCSMMSGICCVSRNRCLDT